MKLQDIELLHSQGNPFSIWAWESPAQLRC